MYTFAVTNGVKGDTGDQTYVWIRYSGVEPTSDADISANPDNWMGVYSGIETDPNNLHYTDFNWFEIKGATGSTGAAATIVSQEVKYQQADSGSVVPEGSWTETVPSPVQGKYLWTRTQIQFNSGSLITSYSVARYGLDGSGSVASVNSVSPDQNGNVQLLASDIQASDSQSVQTHLTEAESDIAQLQEAVAAFHTWHVNSDGTGDYTTISAAVSAASDGDIIIVHPATYTESVHAYGKKVHIKGVDKKTCILQYSGLDYANPPLEMAKGSVENLTINCLNSGTQGSSSAYCVHIDNDNEANQTLMFHNVRFYNPVHQAVGIGLRHNFELVFDNCELEAGDQAALYCHDWETADSSADKSNQKLIMHNCMLRNSSFTKATIMLQSQELSTGCATCEFVGCGISNGHVYGEKISMTMWQGRTLTNGSYLGSSDWLLSGKSSLNTAVLANATKDYVIEEYTFSVTNGIAAGTAGRRAAQVTASDKHPDMQIVGIQITSIQSSADYNPLVFYSSGTIYCNYYAASGSASNATTVVARITYK